MRKANLSILLLASGLILGACATNSGSSASASSATAGTTTSTSETTAGTETSAASSASSSEDFASEYGTFSITPDSGFAEATYDAAAKTYTIHVASSKVKYTLVGYFAGQIIIDNGNSLSSYKGCQLTMNKAYVVNEAGAAISYTNTSKNVEIVAAKDTVNYLVAGEGAAIESENNVEVDGEGTLNLDGVNHGIHAKDIRFYGSPIINVLGSEKSALLGKTFSTDNGSTGTSYVGYSGTLTIQGGEQAFKMFNNTGTDDAPVYTEGTIDICLGATVVIDSVKNVACAVTLVSIEGTVTATNVYFSSTPVTALNAGALSLTVTGTFTVNGTAIASQTI